MALHLHCLDAVKALLLEKQRAGRGHMWSLDHSIIDVEICGVFCLFWTYSAPRSLPPQDVTSRICLPSITIWFPYPPWWTNSKSRNSRKATSKTLSGALNFDPDIMASLPMAALGPKPQSSSPWKAHGFDAPKVRKAELQNISKRPSDGFNEWIGFRENLNRKPWFLRISQSKLFPVNCPIIQFWDSKLQSNFYGRIEFIWHVECSVSWCFDHGTLETPFNILHLW